MLPTASETQAHLSARIQNALEQKSMKPQAYEKYTRGNVNIPL